MTDRNLPWKGVGPIAAVLIVLSLAAHHFLGVRNSTAAIDSPVAAEFVGSAACRDCHTGEYQRWEGSHHDRAMDVASEASVLGDFDDSEFTLHGVTSRFYRKDGRFFVHTNGPGGAMGDFEITHTFGWFPLQQYLVPFPGGRLQTLPIAWDARDGRWFRVPPEGPLEPDDWLYWTNAAQNWNGMCAQCHSTRLEKNYEPETDSYNTTWSDIDVGCEACHGAGSEHVRWAEHPDASRPQVSNYGLPAKTSGIDSRATVELCAACHSRRGAMADYDHAEADLMDSFLPSLLTEDLYFADGQILEEVYVYGSFLQSKMYRHGVSCKDCHDPHSIKRLREGNELCLQCHRALEYDSREHHFHKRADEAGEPIVSAAGEVLFAVGSGAQCVECHMPGRYYMGVDYRLDHGFRIPDPALSAAVGSPDACLRCHVDKDSRWSQETVSAWYGPGRGAHYGEVLARGRAAEAGAGADLARLAADELYPAIVRATALSLLAAYPGDVSLPALTAALADEEAVIRRTAVSTIQSPDPAQLANTLAPLLGDPVRAVRIEAASRLAGEPSRQLSAEQRALFDVALQEFEATLQYSADFASGRHNLGNLYARLGRPEDAVREYEAAIRIDNRFYPAVGNLAVLYSQLGQNDKAEQLLRGAVQRQPELYDLAYSLGLLLVELQRYGEAVTYLEHAAGGLPERARIRYNLGLLHQQLGDLPLAERELRSALALEPGGLDYQLALADHYLRTGDFEAARPIVEDMLSMHPEEPAGQQMLEVIRRGTDGID